MPDAHLSTPHTPADDHDRRRRLHVPAGLREATRLTRTGDLAEATALIQRTLGAQPAGAPAQTSPPRPPTGLRFERPASHSSGGGAGRFVSSSLSNHAGSRSYKLYVPQVTGSQPKPLLVMLHGCTQDADDFAAGTRMNALAETHGFLVTYPQQSARVNPSKCWNWFEAGDQRRDSGEPSIIADITRQIASSHAVDKGRVFVAGLSAGAAMAVIMGATYPDLYAAVGVHSGLAYGVATDLVSALRAMKQGSEGVRASTPLPATPMMVFHGDRDQTVNQRNGDEVLGPWTAGAAQTVGEPRVLITVHRGQVPGGHAYTRSVYRDAGGRSLAEGWSVHGLGHAWSGGDPSGSFTDPEGPDASTEMVRFFTDVTERG
ncbi:MAG: extracellular catalytic domain type 1 short-chain-length polyhydroxyalkanoate depolymerase [Egibacteraceae bacterium]